MIYVYVCTNVLTSVLRSFTKICMLVYSTLYHTKNIDLFKTCASRENKIRNDNMRYNFLPILIRTIFMPSFFHLFLFKSVVFYYIQKQKILTI